MHMLPSFWSSVSQLRTGRLGYRVYLVDLSIEDTGGVSAAQMHNEITLQHSELPDNHVCQYSRTAHLVYFLFAIFPYL